MTLAAATLCAPVASWAAKPEVQADDLIREGIRLRRAGRDDAALEKFRKANEVAPGARPAAQLGLCLQALGRWTEAEDHLTVALEATEDPWVQKNRDTIKDALEVVKTKIGRFEISGSPEGASVAIDGRVIGQFPLAETVRLNVGESLLDVSAPGYESGRRSLQVEGASFRRIEVHLQPAAGATATASQVNEVPDVTALESGRGDSVDMAAQADEPRPLHRRPLFWGAVAGVVVAGVVAAILLSGGKEIVGPDADGRVQL